MENEINFKSKFLNKVKNKKLFKNEVILAVFNFSLTLVTFIILIAITIASKSSHLTNVNVNVILVYALYLPVAILNILLCCFLLISMVLNHPDKFKKTWFFYLPIGIIFIEIFILPIMLSLIAWLKIEQINAGILWSQIVFAFTILLLAILNLVFVYKSTLDNLVYVTSNEDEENPKKDNKNKPIKQL